MNKIKFSLFVCGPDGNAGKIPLSHCSICFSFLFLLFLFYTNFHFPFCIYNYSYVVLSLLFLFTFLSCPILLYSILSFPILSYFIVSYRIVSFPFISLSFLPSPILPFHLSFLPSFLSSPLFYFSFTYRFYISMNDRLFMQRVDPINQLISDLKNWEY